MSDEKDSNYHMMRMNGMSPSGLPIPEPPIQVHIDTEIGTTMGETTVKQMPDGIWLATCPIETLFGSEVDGKCCGIGRTKEEALEALAKDRRNLNDSLWA
jgi:hypothetical protein